MGLVELRQGLLSSYVSFVIGSILGAAAFAGISLMVGARVDNTETANAVVELRPASQWILSGAFFSYERFPEWLHPLIRALPPTALVDDRQAISNQGASLAPCWDEGASARVFRFVSQDSANPFC